MKISFLKTCLVFTLALGIGLTAMPARTEAYQTVLDPVNLVKNALSAALENKGIFKELTSDRLAWIQSISALQSLNKSMINFVNSGFDGSPAFVTDINKTMLSVGDAQAEAFLKELESSNSVKSPWRDDLSQNLREYRYRSTGAGGVFNQNPFTLDQVSSDPAAFTNGDFSKGGLDALFSSFMNPQNNPYGSTLLTQQAFEGSVGNAEGNRLTEINWGQGIGSYHGTCGSSGDVSLGSSKECPNSPIIINGSVLHDTLVHTLGAGIDKTVSADEVSEFASAPILNLLNEAFSKGGIAGLSKPSTGGGSSYADNLTNASNTQSASLSQAFLQTITEELGQVSNYQSNWQRIQAAGQQALSACSSRNNTQAISTIVQPALNSASAALVKAANATAELGKLQSQAKSAIATGGKLADLNKLSEDFQGFDGPNSDILPTPTEVAESESQASAGTDSLLSQLSQLSVSCVIN
ncbi:MAG: hypothetical protein JWN64_555 [Parcubacteria group bacterium]|nr:hypothetical protein [Parcubacteria group bacterium]